jgi:hypothetical protein
MALSKEQEELLNRVSTDTSYWRYGHCVVYNVFPEMPNELVTEELCLAVAQKNGHMLIFVPEELKTEAVCRAAVESSGFLGDVPDKLKTEALCLIAVQKRGASLSQVPERLKTEALCIAAVKQDAYALQYVPKKLQSKVKTALVSDTDSR